MTEGAVRQLALEGVDELAFFIATDGRPTDREMLRAVRPIEASVATEHAASSYGIPVLVIGGEAVGSAEALGICIESASAEEREALRRGGYDLPDCSERLNPYRYTSRRWPIRTTTTKSASSLTK